MKKVFSLFLSVLMLTSVVAAVDLSAYAETSGDFYYSVLEDGTASITQYTGSATELAIPSSIDGYTVTRIYENAFYNCTSLTSVTIPDSVISIGGWAFNDCTSLISVTIGDSVTGIGESAFEGCTSLTSVTIGNSVTSIGEYAFYNCTNLSSVTIPDSVTTIGTKAFDGCSSLVSIIIPDSVTKIGLAVFYGCDSLTNITISNNVTPYISEDLFYGCTSLKSITVPNSVETISAAAFMNCISLTSITIPESVTKIEINAFENCTNLTDVYYAGSEIEWNEIKIEDNNECLVNATIHFSDGTTNKDNTTCTTHTWDSGKTTTRATCAKTGVKTYTCTVCGATKTESIAKTAHTYKNVITKATTSKNGKITPKCSVCGATKTATTIYKIKSMSLSTSSYTYNGKAKKPSVTVKDSKGNKISSKYYTVSYISQSTGKKVSSMKNPGKYYVKVTFKTRYSGSLKKAVTIKPKKTSIKSIKASSKGFTVKWGKVSTQNTGYQVQYSTSKSFKSAKTATVKKTGTTSKKITKLKAKKKYYVRVRTYKTVKVNGKSTKLYSSWSSVKGVTTKK